MKMRWGMARLLQAVVPGWGHGVWRRDRHAGLLDLREDDLGGVMGDFWEEDFGGLVGGDLLTGDVSEGDLHRGGSYLLVGVDGSGVHV